MGEHQSTKPVQARGGSPDTAHDAAVESSTPARGSVMALAQDAAARLLIRCYASSLHDLPLPQILDAYRAETEKDQAEWAKTDEEAKAAAAGVTVKPKQKLGVRDQKLKDSRYTVFADAVLDYLGRASEAELTACLASLNAKQLDMIASICSNESSSKTSPQEAKGRIYLAATPAQRKAMGSFWLSRASYEWGSSAEQIARLCTAVRLCPRGEQLTRFFMRIGERLKSELRRNGIDPSPDRVQASDLPEFVASEVTSALSQTDGPYGQMDLQTLAQRWASLSSSVRQATIASLWSPAQNQYESEWFILLVADPAERKPYLPQIPVAFSKSPLNGTSPAALGPWFKQVRAELAPADRKRLDEHLTKMNRLLGVACGVLSSEQLTDQDLLQLKYDDRDHAGAKFRAVERASAPNIRHDHGHLDDGSGNIDEKKQLQPTANDYLAKAAWMAKLQGAVALRPDLADATRFYRHFLEASGDDLQYSYDRYAESDPSGAQTVDMAMEELRRAAIQESDARGGGAGRFHVQTGALSAGGSGRYPYPSTENWQKTIGAPALWLEGAVVVTQVAPDGTRSYSVDMTLHAEDRYNFNPGANDVVTQIPDSENGRFELTGLGKEFITRATLKRKFTFVVAGKQPRLPPGVTPEPWRSKDTVTLAPPGHRPRADLPAMPRSCPSRCTLAWLAAAVLATSMQACSNGPPPPPVSKGAPLMTVHTELARLAERIQLPPGATAARWIARARGAADPRVPGPTDTILTAYVAISPTGWAEVERTLGAPSKRGALRLEGPIAQAILPEGGAGAEPLPDGALVLGGAEYNIEPLTRPGYEGTTALRWRDGLVFQLFSR